MKSKKRLYVKLVCWVLIAGVSLYVCTFGIAAIRENENIFKQEKTQTVISIWHVETFEGGKKPRIDFLKSTAKEIESTHDDLLFMIKSVKPENLESELDANSPDIISFGYGVGKIVLPFLTNFTTTFNARDELVSSGMFNNKFFAVPYMVGGYSLFNHTATATNFCVGSNDYIHPERIYEKMNLKPLETQTQFEAYKNFVYDKNSCLLGSTRDLFRVTNLNSIGRLSAMISPVDSYTDLIQYLGVVNSNNHTLNFVDKCLSFNKQNKLVDYALFSSLSHKLYNEGIYNDMENAILNADIPNVFYD